jgi:hypothetical protein
MKCGYEYYTSSIRTLQTLMFHNQRHVEHAEMLMFLRDVSIASAFIQSVFLTLVMLAGKPGLYTDQHGMMYVSDNFCTKSILAGCFMISTFPTWALLACSVALEKKVYYGVLCKRRLILFLISTPLPLGLGIVFFSLCSNPFLHYMYVNIFVLSVAGVHLAVAGTAGHFVFLQSYFILLVATAVCGVCFVTLAVFETSPGVQRNCAVIFEYFAIVGFVILNSLSSDRIREHIDM